MGGESKDRVLWKKLKKKLLHFKEKYADQRKAKI